MSPKNIIFLRNVFKVVVCYRYIFCLGEAAVESVVDVAHPLGEAGQPLNLDAAPDLEPRLALVNNGSDGFI